MEEPKSNAQKQHAQPPEEIQGTLIETPGTMAAGTAAVLKTFQFGSRMGVLRGARMLLQLNQKEGFDCQSCAWPNPDGDRHMAEFCENGVKAVADEATQRRILPEFFRRHSVAELSTQSDLWLNQQGRLTHPMILKQGATHYEPIGWDDAFEVLANELNALNSPHESAFYTSGRASNEAAFLYQLFVRQFGTNNLPDCSNMCHESSGAALNATIGVGKGTVTLADFEKADAIFVIGQNPGTNHPRMLTSLQAAKANGCRIVSINPLPEPGNSRFKNPQDFKNLMKVFPSLLGKGGEISDLFLQVRINGDMAAMRGIMKEMLEKEDAAPGSVFDHAFIQEFTTGYESFLANLRATPWDEILEGSGLRREEIHQAAEIALDAKKVICCWAMGLTQHKNAVGTIQDVVNFLLLRGNLGREGAGACPVRGHSNVQGDRTMGVWEKMAPAFMERLGKEFNFQPPKDHGADTVDAIQSMHAGRIHVFFGLGGNFLSATPDTEFTADALRRCRLTAHVSTKLNRAHLITGKIALILPCLGRTEVDSQESGLQFVTVEDSMGVVSSSRGTLKPASEFLLSEPAIVARLAEATLRGRSSVQWLKLLGNYDLIRERIEKVIPGFEGYNKRIRHAPFYLPNAVRDSRKFNTSSGKAHFTVHALPRQKLEADQYVMMTMRSHDQFNTTIYGLDDRYRGIFNGRRVIFMNREDMLEGGLVQGQLVDLTSHFEGERRTVLRFMVAPYSIPRRCTATYFPETNALVPVRSVADQSNTPTSKSVIITISASEDQRMAMTERG